MIKNDHQKVFKARALKLLQITPLFIKKKISRHKRFRTEITIQCIQRILK
jgi:hypothetical protein